MPTPLSTQIVAKVGPNRYNLTDGTIAWRILDENLAMAPVRRLQEQGPLQHGVTDLGFRLDPRIFALTLKTAINLTLAALYDNRKELINIFKPLSDLPVSLEYTLANGDVRQIDCYVNGNFKIDEESRQGFMQSVVIPLKAPDPTFYDPLQQTESFNLSAGGSPTTVPLAVPLTVGTLSINQTKTINYPGTFQTNPVITIVGPISNLVITNETTGEKLDFTGTAISGTWTIDTRYGFKTVEDSSGTNQIAAISDDSNLATFHLEIDPTAPGGANSIKVVGTSASAGTQVYFQWFNRYIGF
jgi:hypothetical protein